MNDRYGWDDRAGRDRNWREGSPRSSYGESHREPPRSSADRWRREQDDWSAHSDREQRYGGSDTLGYGEGRSSHDGGSYGARQVGGYGGSSYGADSRQSYASQGDQRRYSSSDYGYGAGSYGAGQQGDGSAQPRSFIGQQQAWQAPSSYGLDTFAGGSTAYGADYRDHSYAGRQHERGFLQRAGDEVASWFGDEDAARRREADHRGRGPADYIRSDERIREDANDRLTEDWRVDASRVSVAVKDGEITLSGTVTRREDKRRAEDIVEDLSGVKHVQNNLRVEQHPTWSGSSTTSGTVAGKTEPKPPQT